MADAVKVLPLVFDSPLVLVRVPTEAEAKKTNINYDPIIMKKKRKRKEIKICRQPPCSSHSFRHNKNSFGLYWKINSQGVPLESGTSLLLY